MRDPRYDETHPAPGKLFINPELILRDMTVFFRTAVIGGGSDKTVPQSHASYLYRIKQDAHWGIHSGCKIGEDIKDPGRFCE